MTAFYGKSSGMTLLEYYAFLFDLNCKSKYTLSDEEIALKVLQEFPHRKTVLGHVAIQSVSKYRYKFNSGHLHKKYYAPRIPCFRYIHGDAVTPYSCKPLPGSEIRRHIKRQKERWNTDHVRKLKEETKPPLGKRISKGVKLSFKASKKRLRLQKAMAKQQGIPVYDE